MNETDNTETTDYSLCVCSRAGLLGCMCVRTCVQTWTLYIYTHVHSYFALEMEQTRGPHEIDSGLYCLVTDVSINFTLITSLGDICDRQQGPEYCWAQVINVSVMQDCCKFTFGLKNCGALLTLHKLLREMNTCIWHNLLVWSKLIILFKSIKPITNLKLNFNNAIRIRVRLLLVLNLFNL